MKLKRYGNRGSPEELSERAWWDGQAACFRERLAKRVSDLAGWVFGPNPAKRQAARLLKASPPGTLIELGAGCDQFGYTVTKDRRIGTYVRTDVSRSQLEEGRRHARKRGVSNPGIELVVCDANTLPFRQGFSDTVLFLNMLHHLEKKSGMAKSASETLRDGGLLLCLEIDHPLVSLQTLLVHAILHRGIRGEPPEHFVTMGFITKLLRSNGIRVQYQKQIDYWKGRYNLVEGTKFGGTTT